METPVRTKSELPKAPRPLPLVLQDADHYAFGLCEIHVATSREVFIANITIATPLLARIPSSSLPHKSAHVY